LPTFTINEKFNNIKCVDQIECSRGISNEQVVAIFPENFRSVSPEHDYPVFYFVNKFSDRHIKHTRPLLQNLKYNIFFQPLCGLSKMRIGQLVANWVNLHEASHRIGKMPIPKYLFEKSNRYTAAIEELRADLNAISRCFSLSVDVIHDEYLTGIYILAERLFAYPIFREKNNFDAISSIIFWKFLNEQKIFNETLNPIKIKAAIDALIEFIAEMEEHALKNITQEARRHDLKKAILEYVGDINEQFINYNNFWSIE